jgi:hypothetical protein
MGQSWGSGSTKHHSMGMPATKLQPVAIVALTVPLNYNDVHL